MATCRAMILDSVQKTRYIPINIAWQSGESVKVIASGSCTCNGSGSAIYAGTLCAMLLTTAPSLAQQASASGEAIAVPRVSVTGSEEQPTGNGSTEVGYRVDSITEIGPFSNMKLQDIPYSFNVLSSSFIEDTQSYTSAGASVLDKSPFFAYTYNDQRGVVDTG